MKDFYKGKSALITGGSSGIGLAIATELASYGCVVTLLARDEVKLGSAKASIETKHPHAHVETLSSDICDSDSLFALLDQFYTNHDVPDLVVNSAGFSHPGEFVDQSLDLFRQQMEINYLGTVYVLKSLVPRMIAKKSGHIVNISSAVGFLNIYGYSAYGAAKFAVTGLTEALRMELKPHGINLHLAIPSDVKTPQLEYENQYKPEVTKAINKIGGLSDPEDVARDILDGVAKNKYLILPGADVKFLYRALQLLGKPFFFAYLDKIVSSTLKKLAK